MSAHHSTGSATNYLDLRDALITFLTGLCGWSVQSGTTASKKIITKGTLVYQLDYSDDVPGVTYPRFYVTAGEGVSSGALVNPTPRSVMFASPWSSPLTFPLTYEFFQNDTPEEVYIVIAYGGNKFQHITMGKSDQAGVGGLGTSLTGQYREDANPESVSQYSGKVYMDVVADPNSGGAYARSSPYNGAGLGYYFCGPSGSYYTSYFHGNLEGGTAGWYALANGIEGSIISDSYDLLVWSPSAWNQATLLVPASIRVRRASDLYTTVHTLRHARLCRIDNLQPGDIIQYGADQWKVFPLYCKNAAERFGVSWATGAEHSGTFGVALRLP
jgi:hypothetical protein